MGQKVLVVGLVGRSSLCRVGGDITGVTERVSRWVRDLGGGIVKMTSLCSVGGDITGGF